MPAAPLSGRDLPLSCPHAPTSLPAHRRPGLMPWSCRSRGFGHATRQRGRDSDVGQLYDVIRRRVHLRLLPVLYCPAAGFGSRPGLHCWACSLMLLGRGNRMGRCRNPFKSFFLGRPYWATAPPCISACSASSFLQSAPVRPEGAAGYPGRCATNLMTLPPHISCGCMCHRAYQACAAHNPAAA